MCIASPDSSYISLNPFFFHFPLFSLRPLWIREVHYLLEVLGKMQFPLFPLAEQGFDLHMQVW